MSNKSVNHRQSKATSDTTSESTKKTNKRKIIARSPETTPLAKKTPIEMGDKPVTFEEIKALFTEQHNLMRHSVKDEMNTMKNELISCFDAKLNQLNDRISAVESQVHSRIDQIVADIQHNDNQTNCSEDDLNRIAKLNNLKIKGIPHSTGENLDNIFRAIAEKMNFDTTNPLNVPTAVRFYRKNIATKLMSPSPIIVLKFIAKHIRDDFYTHYLDKIAAKQYLMSEDLGLGNGTRIIISEDLTENNSKLLTAALNLKKEGKLCQAFTYEGLVKVKAIKTEKSTTIRSQIQLEIFVQSNQKSHENSSQSNYNASTTTTTSNVIRMETNATNENK